MSDIPTFDHRFKFTWHTNWLEPCRKCQGLNGKTFDGTSVYEGALYDPIWGDVWDITTDTSMAHPNCKCFLEVTYEATIEELLHPSKVTTFIRDGETVTTARDIATGRFTSLNPFQEFGIMTSNIKEMKEDIKSFEKDLARADSRISNTRMELMTYMQLLQRMGLPPQVEKAISVMVKARMVSEQATRAFYALQAATLTGGPAAWAFAIATTGVAVLGGYSTASSVMELGGT
jgi:hypothetical protein